MGGRGDKNCLFAETVDNDENGVVTGGGRKRFNEVHRYGVPWAFRNGELLEYSIGLMPLGLGTHASGAGLDVFLDKVTDSGPSIVALDEVDCLGLTRMSC